MSVASASVTVMVKVARTSSHPSLAVAFAVYAFAAASGATVPPRVQEAAPEEAEGEAQASPAGSPVTASERSSPSASVAETLTAAIVSPCVQVAASGTRTFGARLGRRTVTVKVALTSGAFPSFAVTVTVWACTAAVGATAPETFPVAAAQARPEGRPVTPTVGESPSASETTIANGAIRSPRR